MSRVAFLIAVVVVVLIAWAAPAGNVDKLRQEAIEKFGVLRPVKPADLSNPKVALGRALFWDVRLSRNGKTACASCHLATEGGADRRRFSLDARDKETSRNSQTVFNAMLQPSLRWTGDRTSGVHQAEKSLTGSIGFDNANEVLPLLKRFDYTLAFEAAYPSDGAPLSPTNYAKALQAYQATLLTPAPFDRYLAGDDGALTAPQKTGLAKFLSVGCADCHKGPLLGGDSLRKFGVRRNYWTATGSEKRDAGVYESTKAEIDRDKFRVSMLRNIANTSPYFHDGSVKDLSEAVQIMADVQLGDRLTDADAAAIVRFLESLSGDVPAHYSPPRPKAVANP